MAGKKKSTKSKSKKGNTELIAMAKKISKAWKHYKGNLTYAAFTKKMWKDN